MRIESALVSPLRRSPVKRPLHSVDFFCRAPNAHAVFLVGDFNEWNPLANPMNRMPDGGWQLRLSLYHGHHQYYFLVDGHPILDPRAVGTVRNQRGDPVSLLAVS
jgi:1,4-alpha-glucan branching enzyme